MQGSIHGPAESASHAAGLDDVPSLRGGETSTAEPVHEAASRDLARKLLGGTQSSVGLVAAAVIGTAVGDLLIRYDLVTLVVLAAYALTVLGLYFWGTVRRSLGALRTPGQPRPARRAPEPEVAEPEYAGSRDRRAWRARSGTMFVVFLLAACGYVLGYWVIGYGFAHSAGQAVLSLLLTLIVIFAVIVTARRRPRSWPPWLLTRTGTALACCIATVSLSAGATLGRTDLVPPCPAPAELRVLTSQEDLGAIQAAIPAFEQYEPRHRHQACYVVDVTAYAAPSDGAPSSGLPAAWGQAALYGDGPRPDIWIPSSSAEVRDSKRLHMLGPIGSSPLVVAIPDEMVSKYHLARLEQHRSWDSLYNVLSDHHIGLAMPNPELSETARLGIAGLYPLTLKEERVIEASGSFPPDSGNLLCGAAQAAEHDSRPATGYLVSEAALISSNARRLTAGACTTLASAPPPLTALYPADAAALDFPFVTVNWGGSSPGEKARRHYEDDFYHWLAGQAASRALLSWGLRPPGCREIRQEPGITAGVPRCGADLPTNAKVNSALTSFRQAQAPAHILIGIDDSAPMESYLSPITAAIDAELGPSGTHVGSRDSFGIWELPGPGKGQTEQPLVPFGKAAAARPQVSAGLGLPTGHAHSANYDMLRNAAALLHAHAGASPKPINSVIMLTDGDGHPPGERNDDHTVRRDFSRPPSPIKLFIIAFGPVGCAQSGTGSASESMGALAVATGGMCLWANGSDPRPLLAHVLGQISAGG